MYAQMVETGLRRLQDAADMTPEERAFQARVDADVKVEPKDWMPEPYRRTLVRQISERFPNISAVPVREALATVASVIVRLPSMNSSISSSDRTICARWPMSSVSTRYCSVLTGHTEKASSRRCRLPRNSPISAKQAFERSCATML